MPHAFTEINPEAISEREPTIAPTIRSDDHLVPSQQTFMKKAGRNGGYPDSERERLRDGQRDEVGGQ